MIVKATSQFFKKLNTLISLGIISLEDYEKTRDIFKSNPRDSKIRPHKIKCKKGQAIVALSIINKSERIIKDSRNCKSLFINCEEARKLLDI